jgi:hypothetical protein
LVLLINVYILSSTKLEIREKQFVLGSEGVGEEGGGMGKWRGWGGRGGEKGEEMTQSLFAHMNKIN